jgi:hypothetical protein
MVVGDATINALLVALCLPHDYPWVWRGQSGAGWALAILCEDPMPAGVLPAKKNESGIGWGYPARGSGAGWHHLELRYAHCQTVYPPRTIIGATQPPKLHQQPYRLQSCSKHSLPSAQCQNRRWGVSTVP